MRLTLEFEDSELPKLAVIFSFLGANTSAPVATEEPKVADTIYVDDISVSVESEKDSIVEEPSSLDQGTLAHKLAEEILTSEEAPMEYSEFQSAVMPHVARLGDKGASKIAAYLDSEFGTKSAKQLKPELRRAALAGIEQLA